MTAMRIMAGVAGSLLLAGCWPEDVIDGATFRSETGVVPAAEQRPGDPEAGYRALVNAPYVSCGIPYNAYRRVAPDVGPSPLAGREGRNADLPYAATAHVNAEGIEIVSSNCLTCHAAEINGELIVGLGNEFADFTADPSRLALQAGTYVRGEAETAAWAHWADRITGIAPYIQTATVGVNPATNLTWALMAHLDPETLAWSDTPLIDPPPADPLPISVPPWWGMHKKNAMFYTTIGRGDHARFMLLASMLCIEGTEEAEEIAGYADDIRAYIASLRAPAYPFEVDAALAARGEEIFARDCSACHGTYGDTPSFPNRP
jgi:mono/diheme cytochrome c family protein